MNHITGHTTEVGKDTRYDEETETTRTRRVEREGEYNPRTMSRDRTKTTTLKKRGPDGKLQGVKSRTRQGPHRIDEFEDDINYATTHRDKLP